MLTCRVYCRTIRIHLILSWYSKFLLQSNLHLHACKILQTQLGRDISMGDSDFFCSPNVIFVIHCYSVRTTTWRG